MRPYSSSSRSIMFIGSDKMDDLYESIIEGTKDTDDIFKKLDLIKGPTLCVGSGGSCVVASFMAHALARKKGIITLPIEPSSIKYLEDLYQSIVVCSYSGRNFGVRYALDNDKERYLYTSRKTSVNKETLIHYDLEDEKSFISLKSTIIPMAIILKYYLGDRFQEVIDDMFQRIDKNITLGDYQVFNIFASASEVSATTFLTSTFTEAGLGIPIVHLKYDYCHGRSTINKGKNQASILFSHGSDLDEVLKEILPLTMAEGIVISSPYSDDVCSDFYYTLMSFYLVYNMALKRHIDLKEIDYNRPIVKRLYHFEGRM